MVSNAVQIKPGNAVNQGVHADTPGPNKVGASTPYDFERAESDSLRRTASGSHDAGETWIPAIG